MSCANEQPLADCGCKRPEVLGGLGAGLAVGVAVAWTLNESGERRSAPHAWVPRHWMQSDVETSLADQVHGWSTTKPMQTLGENFSQCVGMVQYWPDNEEVGAGEDC